jgi:hypothetical protein
MCVRIPEVQAFPSAGPCVKTGVRDNSISNTEVTISDQMTTDLL